MLLAILQIEQLSELIKTTKSKEVVSYLYGGEELKEKEVADFSVPAV